VIYLGREGCLEPYARTFSGTICPASSSASLSLSLLSSLLSVRSNVLSDDDCLALNPELVSHPSLVSAMRDYSYAVDNGRLCMIHYTTVTEYLSLLQAISKAMEVRCGQTAIYYLAAAVSDYYMETMAEHKIPSSGGNLTLSLDKVPKCLGILRREWAPRGLVVSFKLETDRNVLMDKAEAAVETYGVDMVVANVLHERNERVYLVSRGNVGGAEEVRCRGDDTEIEEHLVDRVIALHYEHMSKTVWLGPDHISAPQRKWGVRQCGFLGREWWTKIKAVAWRWGQPVLGAWLSYWISNAIRRSLLHK